MMSKQLPVKCTLEMHQNYIKNIRSELLTLHYISYRIHIYCIMYIRIGRVKVAA